MHEASLSAIRDLSPVITELYPPGRERSRSIQSWRDKGRIPDGVSQSQQFSLVKMEGRLAVRQSTACEPPQCFLLPEPTDLALRGAGEFLGTQDRAVEFALGSTAAPSSDYEQHCILQSPR